MAAQGPRRATLLRASGLADGTCAAAPQTGFFAKRIVTASCRGRRNGRVPGRRLQAAAHLGCGAMPARRKSDSHVQRKHGCADRVCVPIPRARPEGGESGAVHGKTGTGGSHLVRFIRSDLPFHQEGDLSGPFRTARADMRGASIHVPRGKGKPFLDPMRAEEQGRKHRRSSECQRCGGAQLNRAKRGIDIPSLLQMRAAGDKEQAIFP